VVGVFERNIPAGTAPEVYVFQITVAEQSVLQTAREKAGIVQIRFGERDICHNAVIEIILQHIGVFKKSIVKPRPGKNTVGILCFDGTAAFKNRVIIKTHVQEQIVGNDMPEVRAVKIHEQKNLVIQFYVIKGNVRQIKADKLVLLSQVCEKFFPIRFLVVNMMVTYIPERNSVVRTACHRTGY
jgi:hypothetical protein